MRRATSTCIVRRHTQTITQVSASELIQLKVVKSVNFCEHYSSVCGNRGCVPFGFGLRRHFKFQFNSLIDVANRLEEVRFKSQCKEVEFKFKEIHITNF